MARIIKSDSPEYAALMAISKKPSDAPATAQEKAFELAENAKNPPKDIDWSQWLMAGGGGLLAHSIASSVFDRSDDERRRESIWSKLLRLIIPLGVGAAGAYGGYVLGDKMKKEAANPATSWPMWDPGARKWILPGDVASHDGAVADLFGEKQDAADKWKWSYGYPFGAGVAGAGVSGQYALRNTKDWMRYKRLKPEIERSMAVEDQMDEIKRLQDSLAKDKATAASNDAALRAVADENATAQAIADSENAKIRGQNIINRNAHNTAEADFQNKYNAWERGGRKGKPPIRPKPAQLSPRISPVVKPNPTPAPLSGVTEAQLTSATKKLRGMLGRRAVGGWLGTLASLGLVDEKYNGVGLNPGA